MILVKINYADMHDRIGVGSSMLSLYTVHGGKVEFVTAPTPSGVPGYVFKLQDDISEADFIAGCSPGSCIKVFDIS